MDALLPRELQGTLSSHHRVETEKLSAVAGKVTDGCANGDQCNCTGDKHHPCLF